MTRWIGSGPLKRMILLLAVTLSGASAVPAGASSSGSPAMQAVTGDNLLHMPDMPLHDPWIVVDREAGIYRLFTRNEPAMTGDRRVGIMVYTSRNLRDWEPPHLVFALPPSVWANDGAWAPEVHPWKGRWYLFATFYNQADKLPTVGSHHPVRRSTLLAVSDRLDGPYSLVRNGAPIVDPSVMNLDGTLYVDPQGRPWIVCAHEWVQIGDGTIEAMPLNDDLSSAGPAIVLFKGSDAPWISRYDAAMGKHNYVTDGPELFRTKTGALLMLWSSYDRGRYVQAIARSRSGEINGPWKQLPPLVQDDSGHGMLFHALDGRLMLVLHHPFRNARGRLYVMKDEGDHLAIVCEAKDLDMGGSPAP